MEKKKIVPAIKDLLGEAGKKLSQLGDELAERGRLKRENAEENAERLIDKAMGKPRDTAKIAREILQDAFDTLGLATAADLAGIRERLEQIDKNIKKMKSAGKEKSRKKAED